MAGPGRHQHTSAAAAGLGRAHSSETLARLAAGPGFAHECGRQGQLAIHAVIQLHPAKWPMLAWLLRSADDVTHCHMPALLVLAEQAARGSDARLSS